VTARLPSSPAKSVSWWRTVFRRPEFITLALILAMATLIAAINPAFLQPQSLFDLLRSTARIGVFALGVLLVLAAGGIDVSFTAVAIFSAYLTSLVLSSSFPDAPFLVSAVLGCGVGLLLGVFNGFVIHRFKAPSLIVTIGTQYLIRGALLAFLGTKYITNLPAGMTDFGRWNLMVITTAEGARVALPMTVAVVVIVALLTWFILNRTLLGRAIYAVGGNSVIAERLGINVGTVMLFVCGYAGLLAGLGGLMHVSSSAQANPFDLVGSELDVIAAVVLGGARVTGGTGTVTGTLLGVVLVVLINNSLILMGVPSTWQKVVIGAIILFASLVFSRLDRAKA
jgi:simple sugar transport system permease protein